MTNECVTNWPGRCDKGGYPIINIGRKYRTVARLMYEIFVGPVPEGLHILHNCDNKKCINPLHLRHGTHAENMTDKKIRGRQPRTSRFPAHVIQMPAVEARAKYGISKSQYYRLRQSNPFGSAA